MSLVTRRSLGLGMAGTLALPGLAAAQAPASWPTRPVRWLVGFLPGGATDVVARVLANAIGPHIPFPIVIENRAGAAGTIAADAAAKSAPDGYTALTVDMGAMVYNRALFRKLPYDPTRDFTLVALYIRIPFTVAVSQNFPARNMQEFVAYAKANPGKISMASVGVGSPHHLGLERLQRIAGIKVTHVPYRGGAAFVNDLSAGTLDAAFLDYATGVAGFQSNRIRAIASATEERVAEFPDVPTLAEQGIQGSELSSYQGVVMPAGTPPAIVRRFGELVAEAIRSPGVVSRVRDLGAVPMYASPGDFQRVTDREAEIWLPIIRDLNIALD